MQVDDAFHVRKRHQDGKLFLLGLLDFPAAFPQFRRNVLNAECLVDVFLRFAGNPDGSPLKPDTVSASVSLLFRSLKLPKDASLHTLRHTHGSHLPAAGVPLTDVSKRLGHVNPHVTATVYAHAMPGHDDLAAAAWEKFQITGRVKETGVGKSAKTYYQEKSCNERAFGDQVSDLQVCRVKTGQLHTSATACLFRGARWM
jgi:hypothetical protein